MTKSKKDPLPEHWSEIPENVRQAMVDQANDRLFWKSFFTRLGAFSKIAQMLLLIGTLVALVRSGAADWILGAKK